MFDLKWIRENGLAFDEALAKRGLHAHSAEILALDDERKQVIGSLQDAQTKRNSAAKAIGAAKGKGDEVTAQKLIDEVAALKTMARDGEEKERKHTETLNELLSGLPNIPLEDVPVGRDESDNVVKRQEGNIPSFSFAPKSHYEIGESMGLMDFDIAAKMSGSRFVLLKGALARLERALAAFMLDMHTSEFGYQEVVPPSLVRDEALYGTAQLPKFAEDLFRAGEGHWLIPTSEVPLTNIVRDSILDETSLPLRYTAHTSCFRSEAGSAGKDTRGMFRQHQFSKVELVSIVKPEDAMAELERMTSCAEEVLKRLGLAYQVVLLATGDMGFAARKTFDLEVWLPGQDKYREISSCSVCGDFQARRMNARFRSEEGGNVEFVNTLNGSGLAIGRAMIAVLENYQCEDGSVKVPEVLRPYMGGLEVIAAA